MYFPHAAGYLTLFIFTLVYRALVQMHKTHFLISWPAAGEKNRAIQSTHHFRKVILARRRREKITFWGGAHHLKVLFELK